MASNSYFKVGRDNVFTFDENDPQSVRNAYAQADALGGGNLDIVAYRPIPVGGAWSAIDRFVGYRTQREILQDIQNAEDRLGTPGQDPVFVAVFTEQLAFAKEELKAHPLSIG